MGNYIRNNRKKWAEKHNPRKLLIKKIVHLHKLMEKSWDYAEQTYNTNMNRYGTYQSIYPLDKWIDTIENFNCHFERYYSNLIDFFTKFGSQAL